MRPEQRDAAYLWDMNQAALEISHFVEKMTFYDFENNKMARYAVERRRTVQIIGVNCE